MYVCMYVCMYVYWNRSKDHVQCRGKPLCMYVCMYVCIYAIARGQGVRDVMRVMYVCVYVYMYMCVCVYIYIYIYICFRGGMRHHVCMHVYICLGKPYARSYKSQA